MACVRTWPTRRFKQTRKEEQMRRTIFILFSALVLSALPGTLKAQDELLCEEEESTQSANPFEKVQLWNKTFSSLAEAEGLTKEQRSVLQAALKLGTPEYFQ